ncbi:hypothetical protein AAVH_22705 [Aphelenchoides avenae]|nr:hypothetical protein AAVH_22705 [Aphelenchus avenae]
MIRQSATTSGRIHELVVNAEGLRVPPSVFEAIPFLAAEVASLQFSYPSNLTLRPTPVRQSEKLLRNCIERGVYTLKLIDKERHCRVPYKPREKSSDISEETILEFCFASRNIRPDRPEQVELWLNWVNLSPEFLSRFVQASEICDSDHNVKLLVRVANVGQQDLSQFRRYDLTDWYSVFGICDSIWTNDGKYTVRVVRNLRTGFFFAHRSTLSLRGFRQTATDSQ